MSKIAHRTYCETEMIHSSFVYQLTAPRNAVLGFTGPARIRPESRPITKLTDRLSFRQQIVKMMVLVLVVFGVCWLPYHIYFILQFHLPEITKGESLLGVLTKVSVTKRHCLRARTMAKCRQLN